MFESTELVAGPQSASLISSTAVLEEIVAAMARALSYVAEQMRIQSTAAPAHVG